MVKSSFDDQSEYFDIQQGDRSEAEAVQQQIPVCRQLYQSMLVAYQHIFGKLQVVAPPKAAPAAETEALGFGLRNTPRRLDCIRTLPCMKVIEV